ncbi:MAG: FliH/SctL family protein [Planktomarina sp.]|nr:FliH/SctL family protein [Planktomarina sp.]
MSVSDLDNIDEASSLTSSDLKGLLKAARLTKYVPDSKVNVVSETFEKSANLFDLVRSTIESPELSVETDEAEVSSSDSIIGDKESNPEIVQFITEEVQAEQVGHDGEMIADKPIDEITSADDTSLFVFDDTERNSVEDNNIDFSEVSSLPTESGASSDSKVGLIDLENIQENDSQDKSLNEESYTVAKLEFERLLQVEKDKFLKLSETLFSVSQTLVGATEEKLKAFILETASKLSGEKIDEIPEKYLSKISRIMDEFATNADEITVTLNREDFAAVKEAKNFKDFLYIFDENEDLMRGEFRIKSGKLMGQVKLHENSINNTEPDVP